MLRTTGTVVLAVLLGIGLTACDPGPSAYEVRAKTALAAHRAALKTLPSQYRDGGTGLGWRLDHRRCLADRGGCAVLDVYAYETCASGYVEGALLDRSKQVVGYVNGTIESMRAGRTSQVRLEWTEKRVRSVDVTVVDCG